MKIEYGVEIDEELEDLFWKLDDWIDHEKHLHGLIVNRRGTTIVKKNDAKRDEEKWQLIYGEGGLEELSTMLFEESGMLQAAINRHKEENP